MKILVVPSSYPYPGHPYAGIFNEKCVNVLKDLCEKVEVMVPHPYAPRLISSLSPRWRAYATATSFEIRNGVPIHRPPYFRIPRLASAFWSDRGAFFSSRRKARELHSRVGFDTILSFDMIGAGGLAWRLGRDLGISSSGWATGDDVRMPTCTAHGRVVIRALQRLDLVFYQSSELFQVASRLLGSSHAMTTDKHIVLPRGIAQPPLLSKETIRKRIRQKWAIEHDQILVLSVGRVVRAKGIFDFLEAASKANSQNPKLNYMIVGSIPAFDETNAVEQTLKENPQLKQRVKLLPACLPHKVWDYLCAADIFAFTSHKEGMPNSLLEAMAMGLPAVSFAIPPVLEIDAGKGALVVVPAFDTEKFSEALLQLAASPRNRHQIGQKARSQVLDRFMVQKNMATALKRLSYVVENHDRSTCRGIGPQHKSA